jgi:hypothetical protein
VSARFDGGANFSSRTFREIADFRGACFYYPPVFDNADQASRIDFTGAHVGFAPPGKLLHWTKNSRIPLLLRTFRKIAEETKNHDLERDLYIEERKALRGVYLNQFLERDELDKKLRAIARQKKHAWLEWRLQRRARNAHWLGLLAKPAQFAPLVAHCLWIIVMWFYWALADYGRSIARPVVVWLVLTFVAFPWLYGQILRLPPKPVRLDAGQYEQTVQMVAGANAVPFIGSRTVDADLKKALFCVEDASDRCIPIPPKCYQWPVVFQNVIFNHPRLFHRPRLAQLFQNQVKRRCLK